MKASSNKIPRRKWKGRLEKVGVHSGFIELVWAEVLYLLDLVVLSALIKAGSDVF